MRKRGTERGARELKTRTENAKQTFLGISRTIAFDTPLSLPATTFFFSFRLVGPGFVALTDFSPLLRPWSGRVGAQNDRDGNCVPL